MGKTLKKSGQNGKRKKKEERKGDVKGLWKENQGFGQMASACEGTHGKLGRCKGKRQVIFF